MDSYVTYLHITSAESGRTSLLHLPPSPHVSPFSLYGCCLLQMQVGGGPQLLYLGEPAAPPAGRSACLPPLHRAVSLPAAPPPGGRGLHAIELKF